MSESVRACVREGEWEVEGLTEGGRPCGLRGDGAGGGVLLVGEAGEEGVEPRDVVDDDAGDAAEPQQERHELQQLRPAEAADADGGVVAIAAAAGGARAPRSRADAKEEGRTRDSGDRWTFEPSGSCARKTSQQPAENPRLPAGRQKASSSSSSSSSLYDAPDQLSLRLYTRVGSDRDVLPKAHRQAAQTSRQPA